MPAMSHLHKNMCWIWSQAACTCRTYLHKKVHIISSLFWYSLVYYLNDLVVGILSYLVFIKWKHQGFFSPGIESRAPPTLPTRNRVRGLVGQECGGDGVPKDGTDPRGSFSRPTNQLCNVYPWHGQRCGWKTICTRLQLSRSQCLLPGGEVSSAKESSLFPQNIWRLPFRLPARPRATRASVCFCPTERLTPVSRPPFRYCAWSRPQEQRAKENKIGIQTSVLNLEQVLPCNDRPCPVDCRWDHWSPWSPCTGISVDNMNFRN